MKKLLTASYVLFIILLPFQLFPFLSSFKLFFSRNASINNCFFVLMIGLLLLIIQMRGVIRFRGSLTVVALRLPILLVLLSLFTSTVLLPVLGELYGKNALSASFSKSVYYLLIALTFYYNAYLFEYLTADRIARILNFLCWFNLLIGAFQLLMIYVIPTLGSIYDALDFFNILEDSTYLIYYKRVCLTCSEPSIMGMSVGVLLLPYAMAQFLHQRRNLKYLFFIVALTAISFFSFSSSVYITIVMNYLVFLFFLFKGSKSAYILIFIFTGLVVILSAFSFGLLDDSYIGDQLSFLLLEKTTDMNNLSTGYRFTTVINDIACFLRYPLSGIGNGNQGFLYNETMLSSMVSDSVRVNYQTVAAMDGKLGLISGGAFVPSFISGYGIIGVLLLSDFVIRCVRTVRRKREEMGYLFEYYCIGALSYLAMGTVAISIEGNFMALFVLSLPLSVDQFREKRLDGKAVLGQVRPKPSLRNSI